MFRVLPSVFLIAFCATNVCAQTESKKDCHVHSDEEKRLNCYDEATGYNLDSTQDAEVLTTNQIDEPSGIQWREQIQSSALESRNDIWLSVRSSNTEPNSIGSPTHAILWLRCMENSTNVFFEFNSYTSDDQSVRYKLDESKINKHWMQVMRGGDGIGIWSGGKAIPFIKQMFKHEKLVLAYRTYRGSVEFVFDISGLEKRIEPLANECQWKM